MNARAIWLVGRREVLTRMRTKAYRFSTLGLVLISVAAVAAGGVLPNFFEEDPLRIGVLPDAQQLRPSLEASAPLFDREIEVVDLVGGQAPEAAFAGLDLDAVIAEPEVVVFEEEVDSTVVALVGRASYEAALPERAGALGLTLDEARSLTEPPSLQTEVLSTVEEDEDEAAAFGIASLATIALLMAMSFYGNWVLVGVIEEKSNRVVEVLLAVVRPWQLLVGKVLGIMALAVTQIAAVTIAVVAALVLLEDVTLPTAGTAVLAMSVAWLVLGLLLYNFIYAAFGATASRPEDSSSVSAPIMIPLFAGYFAGIFYVPLNPDSWISRGLSLFPVTAPLTMPARVASGDVPAFEIALSMVGMVLAIGLVIWIASSIYSGAILQTQRVNLLTAYRRARD